MTIRDFEVRVKPGLNRAGERGWVTVVVHRGTELVRAWESDEAAARDFADHCLDKLADGYRPGSGPDDEDDVTWHPPARLAPSVTAYRDLPDEPFHLGRRPADSFVDDFLRARGFGRVG